jgi:ATP-dependent DNA helicase RecG
MLSVREQIEAWLKPLLLEEKQEFLNRSVVGGLDRFIAKGCDRIIGELGSSSKNLQASLKQVKKEFSQYMTLSSEERRDLVKKTQDQIKVLTAELPLKSKPISPKNNAQLSDLIIKLVPPDKLRAFQLTKLKTADDLLKYAPKWAVHKSLLTPISQCANREEPYFILGRINGISEVARGPRGMLKVVLEDGSGHLSWVWFNRPYLRKELQNGRWVLLHDTPQISKWGKQVVGRAETFEFLTEQEMQDIQAGKVLVFYPSTPTLTQVFWRSLLNNVLDQYLNLLPQSKNFTTTFSKLSLVEAVNEIHRPTGLELYESARKRLAFEELLTLQFFLIAKRRVIERREKGRKYLFEGEKILQFRKSIPYQLTNAQKKVLKEIRENLAKTYPMNRLLQGDVGSGKTLVAAISFLYAADSGIQSAFMAPTEILSQQHYQNLTRLLEPLGLKTALLTSDMKAKPKREVLESLENGTTDLIIGTHALLEDDVKFKNLGFLVIDERHKFGVMQRAALEEKGKWPDCLMMTATPFPRALVLTEYGDTDLSILDEFPKGRKAIKTTWKNESQKETVYQFAKERVLQGEQVFWVFPVVDESKNFLKSAVQMHQHFQKEVFHGFKVGLIHGKMKKEEKDSVMKDFAQNKIQILVSTTVVEVGVDVANATIMVVEHAERFGLAQLHQLRGRVGRGAKQSFCFLLTSPVISSDAIERMKIMASTLDGFKLSEFDLKMRGPGEIFGVAQSGRREGGIVDLKKDIDVVEEARKMAMTILEKDPKLTWEEHKNLRDSLMAKFQPLLDLAQIS